MSRGRARGTAAAIAAGLLLLTACTGVPSSSAPQTVEPLPGGAVQSEQSIRPTVDASANEIVTEFLRANAVDPGNHASARSFLTADARTSWNDYNVTVISKETLGTYQASNQSLTVHGQLVGTLDKNGIYTPALGGDGTGGAPVSFKLTLAQTDDGQFRIASLRPGLLLTDEQFAENYRQHSLYFYDNAQQYLVQDPRYSDLDDRTQLSEWLLARLAAGPRPDLANAVTSNTLPTQADPSRITVSVSTVTKVEIPGSSQLDASGRDHLAAQLSHTLDDPLSGGDITITDGGRPVRIPQTGSTQFAPTDFEAELGAATPTPDVYYLAGGRIVDDAGKPVSGPLGRPGYNLSSMVLSESANGGPILAAGVQGSGSRAALLVGTLNSGLRAVGLSGRLTRPAFAPDRDEVWIGSGTKIFRATIDSAAVHLDQVPVSQAQGTDRVLALRVSPDGARIAVVMAPPNSGGGTLYVGSIVRGSGPVRIDALAPISPQKALITDVAWLNPLRLFAIGRLAGSLDSDSLTFDSGVDGTDWSSQLVGLAERPDAVTVTAGASAWVSAGGYVWVQSAGQWVSPTGGQTAGTAPIYLE